MSTWLGWRVGLWWRAEKMSDHLWDRVCRDGVSCWLDWLPAFTFQHRKNAEKKLYLHVNGVPL